MKIVETDEPCAVLQIDPDSASISPADFRGFSISPASPPLPKNFRRFAAIFGFFRQLKKKQKIKLFEKKKSLEKNMLFTGKPGLGHRSTVHKRIIKGECPPQARNFRESQGSQANHQGGMPAAGEKFSTFQRYTSESSRGECPPQARNFHIPKIQKANHQGENARLI